MDKKWDLGDFARWVNVAMESLQRKKSRTFIILEIQSILFVRDNLFHVYDALVVELS